MTDDDCFVQHDWLMNIEKCLTEAPNSVVTGRVEMVDDNAVMIVVTSLKPEIYRHPSLKYDPLSSGNMGASMSVFNRVGLFEERLRTSEDGEWAYRVLRAGIPIQYAPNIVVRHFGWRDETGRYRQYKAYAHGHGSFYGKYLRQGDMFIALRVLVHHFRSARRLLLGVLRRDRESVLTGWAYLTGLLPGIITGMRKRKS